MLREDIEILAPAGSIEALKAAINAGADAIYMGGSRFGARAYAQNPEEDALLEAIAYVHLYGKKLYLTVNTLLRDEELYGELYDYLLPYYAAGLDAVIVQDLGVLNYIREAFPDLPVHASTQMSLTGPEGTAFMQSLGVSRIVPARELSLKEIRRIHDQTGVEIEAFVHGALCYSYSGRCLLSSVVGGRSGNRGRCAQPCRKVYEAEGVKGNLISMKDLSALKVLPDLIENGVSSFKIEGRMKNPSYVALVTYLYARYVDLYFQKGRKGYHVREADLVKLADVFNRGGFTEGYYFRKPSDQMISTEKANHTGTVAAEVVAAKGRNLSLKALRDLNAGDVLEFSGRKDNYTLGAPIKRGTVFKAMCRDKKGLPVGRILNRTRNNALLDKIETDLIQNEKKIPLSGSLEIRRGVPVTLLLTSHDLYVCATGKVPLEAKNRPVTEESVKKPVMKTGNTHFVLTTLNVSLDDGLFIPNGDLNALRRDAIAGIEKAILDQSKREAPKGRPERQAEVSKKQTPGVSALVSTPAQLDACLKKDFIRRIYISFAFYEEAEKALRRVQDSGREAVFALPHISRRPLSEDEKALLKVADGVLIRNYESLGEIQKLGYEKTRILDSDIYVFNQAGKALLEEKEAFELSAPLEMSRAELQTLGLATLELNVYGNFPVMLSAQCVKNTIGACSGKDGVLLLKDGYEHSFPEKSFCREKYTVLYNDAPLKIFDLQEDICALGPKSLRLTFTLENADETRTILENFEETCLRGKEDRSLFPYTRGHFRRGVK